MLLRSAPDAASDPDCALQGARKLTHGEIGLGTTFEPASKHVVEPWEPAAILCLASDQAATVTGHTIPVDGG